MFSVFTGQEGLIILVVGWVGGSVGKWWVLSWLAGWVGGCLFGWVDG